MRRAIALALLLTGCSESATELTAWQKAMRDGSIETVAATKAVESKTDEAIGILRDNATALAAIKSQIEALQVVSKTANSEEVIKSAPNPPAKANTALAPLKVATPGDFSEPETLVELATRLYAQGVNTHMKTREQLEAIDAQLNGGQPVTGGIFPNNRTSAFTSQRTAVRLVPRGKGVVRWQRNTAGQTCGPNGCY
jgi:hypothetical protein